MYAMFHKDEPKAVLTAIVITVVSLGTFAFVVFSRFQADVATSNFSLEEISGWNIYRNDTYGFRLSYPPGWTLYEDGLVGNDPYVAFGNPISGVKTYSLQIFVENNTSSLSSGEYVHAFLAEDKAEDKASGAVNGEAPSVAPQYERSEVLSVGGPPSYEAYELYGVFEFDHVAEQIYVAHGGETLRFDFPVARENPNLSLPVANNYVAHQIVNTLVFTK